MCPLLRVQLVQLWSGNSSKSLIGLVLGGIITSAMWLRIWNSVVNPIDIELSLSLAAIKAKLTTHFWCYFECSFSQNRINLPPLLSLFCMPSDSAIATRSHHSLSSLAVFCFFFFSSFFFIFQAVPASGISLSTTGVKQAMYMVIKFVTGNVHDVTTIS